MTFRSEKLENKNRRFRFNKADAIAGCAFVGAWVGLILGFVGLIHHDVSSNVSFGLTGLGAVVGVFLVSKKHGD